MRISILVLGLFFGLIVLLESVLVRIGGLFFNDIALKSGGVLGIIVAVLFVFGAILALARPLISLISFGLSGIAGIITGSITGYTDLVLWGAIALALAGMSYFATRMEAGEKPVETGELIKAPGDF